MYINNNTLYQTEFMTVISHDDTSNVANVEIGSVKVKIKLALGVFNILLDYNGMMIYQRLCDVYSDNYNGVDRYIKHLQNMQIPVMGSLFDIPYDIPHDNRSFLLHMLYSIKAYCEDTSRMPGSNFDCFVDIYGRLISIDFSITFDDNGISQFKSDMSLYDGGDTVDTLLLCNVMNANVGSVVDILNLSRSLIYDAYYSNETSKLCMINRAVWSGLQLKQSDKSKLDTLMEGIYTYVLSDVAHR